MGDILGQKLKDVLRTVQMSAPEMSESMIKAVSALGVDSLKQSALQQVGSQLLMQRAKYQTALSVACRGTAPIVQREATIKVCLKDSKPQLILYGLARPTVGVPENQRDYSLPRNAMHR